MNKPIGGFVIVENVIKGAWLQSFTAITNH